MKFLIDRCAGHLLAEWLRSEKHDVVEARELGPDPGDRTLLEWAAAESRILVTMDKGFGQFLFVENLPHSGLIHLPDIPPGQRITLMAKLLTDHHDGLLQQAIFTIRGGRIRISRVPSIN